MSRQVTLRPCDTDFDNKMKAKLAGKLMRFPKISSFIYKRFLLLSWIMIIIMIASLGMIVVGVYNWWAFGNCNGPGSSGFCIFNIDSSSTSSGECFDPSVVRELTPAGPGTGHPSLGAGFVNVTEFGCYTCPYTKKAEPIVKEMLQKYSGRVIFTYRPFPIPTHENSRLAAEAAYCALEQSEQTPLGVNQQYWSYHDLLFQNQGNLDSNNLIKLASTANLDAEMFAACFNERRYTGKIDENLADGNYSGIYGTPTFFVNEQYIVGPGRFSDLELLIKQELGQ